MNKIGFIGYGSMGSMLVKSLINSGLVDQKQIIVTRKDKSRLDEIKLIWPGIRTVDSVAEVARLANYIFICVKPLECKDILDVIKAFILPEKHIISIAGSVDIKNIERSMQCKITKVMPTVLSEVNEGVTLICHNDKVTDEDATFIEILLKSISKVVKPLKEKDFGFVSELTSCAPGFIAALFMEFVKSGLRHTDDFDEDEIEGILIHTLFGTARLMMEKKLKFDEVVSRVATKGGITEEGVMVIKAGLPQIFDELFEQTLNKRRIVNDKVNEEFLK